jgi:hypothetical protein
MIDGPRHGPACGPRFWNFLEYIWFSSRSVEFLRCVWRFHQICYQLNFLNLSGDISWNLHSHRKTSAGSTLKSNFVWEMPEFQSASRSMKWAIDHFPVNKSEFEECELMSRICSGTGFCSRITQLFLNKSVISEYVIVPKKGVTTEQLSYFKTSHLFRNNFLFRNFSVISFSLGFDRNSWCLTTQKWVMSRQLQYVQRTCQIGPRHRMRIF